MKIAILLALSLLTLHCTNVTEPLASSAPAPVTDDLPQPAMNTVEMSLNGVRYTLTNKAPGCQSGAQPGQGDIGFTMPGFASPTLFLHSADLSANGAVTIKSGALNWHMDIDDNAAGAVWGTNPAGCGASVIENTTTVFELKAVGCDIDNQFGAQTGKVSFRVRCVKGP